jgi:hypothetical protein
MRENGMPLGAITARLNKEARTTRIGKRWKTTQVTLVLKRR